MHTLTHMRAHAQHHSCTRKQRLDEILVELDDVRHYSLEVMFMHVIPYWIHEPMHHTHTQGNMQASSMKGV